MSASLRRFSPEMEFPYGKAPLAILVLAVVSGAYVFTGAAKQDARRPDLILATFSKEHGAAYEPAVRAFEKQHDVSIQIQVVSQRALQSRLQSAMQAGAEVPDMVELLYGTMGFFTRGPLEDVRLLDLTDRVRSAGLDESLVTSRFGLWSSRDRLFALPHDVHPVMLAYRRDLVEQLGIDVEKLTTWDEFCRVGREVVTKDLNGDGVYDRYMLDMPADGGDTLRLLILQRGGAVFDESGDVAFDDERAVDVVCWYVKQLQGKDRIVYPCGWGQTFSRAIIDGLCLFYICPDWRTSQIETDIPSLHGKLDLMPLPAWEPGGPRTSVWGGTGLAITRQCANPDLAWRLAMHLYYDRSQLGERFAHTNILPPLKDAWTQPAFMEPRPFWSGRRLGKAYAQLADETPNEQVSPYQTLAVGKLSEAFTNATLYHARHGEAGLREFTRAELKRCADRVRTVMERNTFMQTAAAQSPSPRTRGEGGGEGVAQTPTLFHRRLALQQAPLPNPLPAYGEREEARR